MMMRSKRNYAGSLFSMVVHYILISTTLSTTIETSISCENFGPVEKLKQVLENYDLVLVTDPIKRYIGPVCGDESPQELIHDLERIVKNSIGELDIELDKQSTKLSNNRGSMSDELAAKSVRKELNRQLTSIQAMLDRSKVDNVSVETMIKTLMRKCAYGYCFNNCSTESDALKNALVNLCDQVETARALLLADTIKMSLVHRKESNLTIADALTNLESIDDE